MIRFERLADDRYRLLDVHVETTYALGRQEIPMGRVWEYGAGRFRMSNPNPVELLAALVHDDAYEKGADLRRADCAMIEILARAQAHPVKLLIVWCAIRVWAYYRALHPYRKRGF